MSSNSWKMHTFKLLNYRISFCFIPKWWKYKGWFNFYKFPTRYLICLMWVDILISLPKNEKGK